MWQKFVAGHLVISRIECDFALPSNSSSRSASDTIIMFIRLIYNSGTGVITFYLLVYYICDG